VPPRQLLRHRGKAEQPTSSV